LQACVACPPGAAAGTGPEHLTTLKTESSWLVEHTVVVSSNPLSTTLQLQTPAGLIVPGVSFAKVAEQTAPSGRLIRQAMSFNALLGPSKHLAVDVQALKATVRRHFAWEEFVLRLTRTLADLRQSGPDAVPRRGLTEAALADTWPAEIVNLPALLAYLTTAGRVPLAVSEQGLLALLVDALAEPWDSAREPLPQMPAYRRFARCAMLATEVLDIRDPRDGVLTLFAPDALLGLGRIREFDLPQCALVRATELYVELLPQLFPCAAPSPALCAQARHAHRRMDSRDRRACHHGIREPEARQLVQHENRFSAA